MRKPDQVIDVKEAPVIDLLARDAPERQPVRLLLQQLVQQIEAPRVSRNSIQPAQRLIDLRAHLGRLAR